MIELTYVPYFGLAAGSSVALWAEPRDESKEIKKLARLRVLGR